MSLAELQKMLADALVHREPISREPAWIDRASLAIGGNERMQPAQQLDVYREQFWWRHVACLAEDLPTLAALLGEEDFEDLAAAYFEAKPPADFLLRNLGAGLADFLARHRPDDPLLGDLARVEWAFIDAFDAADAPPLDPASVAAIPEDAWTSARIELNPSLQRLRLLHPAHEMRSAFHRGEPLVRVPRSPTFLVVYRRGLRHYQETLDELAFAMLDRLAAGAPLGEAAEAVASETDREQEVQARIGEWFTRWASLGWIARVTVRPG